ncbi:DNA-3-methyladenine glycosylase [Terricaulis sp.]|uniref:DNA-3-methyladenine glycosylase n=1 Tax=Terricaulis sp. TaxID=2768686 RepID=UPI002AC5271C|nr:DNA-3-methyladenine glycosylase [Terricaulis sp.]MDZ4690944.1 DNA-3-methyladenine glycosylase [Terricaulis sp.]
MPLPLTPLSRGSLPPDPIALARWLIGKRVVRPLDGAHVGGRIVETEAYLDDDPASHSFRGQNLRNRSMFGVRGNAYVYRIYGMWFCFNVSAGAPREGAAVLIRAIEPEFGLDAMAARRRGGDPRDLTRGPGRLCAALAIDLQLDGIDLCRANGALWLAEGGAPIGPIGTSPRIGITKAADAPLRFYERGNPRVSGPKSART